MAEMTFTYYYEQSFISFTRCIYNKTKIKSLGGSVTTFKNHEI
jgi:hypothetical protein